MYFNHTKEFRMEDGSRIRVRVTLHGVVSGEPVWSYDVMACSKGCRTFNSIVDTHSWRYRDLSRDERTKHAIERYKAVAGLDRINETLDEAYLILMPKQVI